MRQYVWHNSSQNAIGWKFFQLHFCTIAIREIRVDIAIREIRVDKYII